MTRISIYAPPCVVRPTASAEKAATRSLGASKSAPIKKCPAIPKALNNDLAPVISPAPLSPQPPDRLIRAASRPLSHRHFQKNAHSPFLTPAVSPHPPRPSCHSAAKSPSLSKNALTRPRHLTRASLASSARPPCLSAARSARALISVALVCCTPLASFGQPPKASPHAETQAKTQAETQAGS